MAGFWSRTVFWRLKPLTWGVCANFKCLPSLLKSIAKCQLGLVSNRSTRTYMECNSPVRHMTFLLIADGYRETGQVWVRLTMDYLGGILLSLVLCFTFCAQKRGLENLRYVLRIFFKTWKIYLNKVGLFYFLDFRNKVKWCFLKCLLRCVVMIFAQSVVLRDHHHWCC